MSPPLTATNSMGPVVDIAWSTLPRTVEVAFTARGEPFNARVVMLAVHCVVSSTISVSQKGTEAVNSLNSPESYGSMGSIFFLVHKLGLYLVGEGGRDGGGGYKPCISGCPLDIIPSDSRKLT